MHSGPLKPQTYRKAGPGHWTHAGRTKPAQICHQNPGGWGWAHLSALGAKGGELTRKRYLFSGFADGRAQSGPTAHICAHELFGGAGQGELDRLRLSIDGDDLLVLQDLRVTFDGVEYAADFDGDGQYDPSAPFKPCDIHGCESLFLTRDPKQCDHVTDCNGHVVRSYRKMHLYDVAVPGGPTLLESGFTHPGDGGDVAVVPTPAGQLGLSVCYDMRFPALWAALGDEHCDAIACPAAFTRPTGAAHWHVLLRARAIEASAYVIAAAQVGEHEDGRKTYGHSLVVDPWGEVVLDMGGDEPGVGFVEIDAARVASVRAQLPSLANRRAITK